MPRVSIGLPIYNGERRFMSEAIESVLAQTFTDFELIICDNASTDRTPEICQQYAERDKRIRYYRNEKNIGISRNFIRAFELGSGEYFKWVSDDGAIEPTYLERCVNLLDNDPSIILACTKYITSVETENRTYPVDLDFELRAPTAYLRLKEIFDRSFFWNLPLWGLMRTDVLRHTGLFRSVIGADYILTVELGLIGQFGQVPEHLALTRRHPDAYTDLKVKNDWVEGRAEAERINPGNTATIFFPHWRRLGEFALLIIRSKENVWERSKMLALLFYPVAFRWKKILLKEVFFALGMSKIWIFMRDMHERISRAGHRSTRTVR